MADPEFPRLAPSRAIATCTECGVPLAPDQRYCISCGARCSALPQGVAALLADIAARRVDEGPGFGETGAGRSAAAAFLASLTPRASAIAVMSMLAFGVVVGSGASSLADSANPPLLLAVSHHGTPAVAATPVAVPSPGTSSGGGSGASPGPTVVTQTIAAQTITAPSSGAAAATSTPATTPSTPTTTPTTTLPPVTHVFLIMLSDQSFGQLYGPQSTQPYLAGTLRRQGELLPNYYAVAPSPLANGIALISGQGPTRQTVANCPQYTALSPGRLDSQGQAVGDGCVYPTAALSVGDQLAATGQTWKAYVESMASGAAASGTSTTGTSTTGTSTAAQATSLSAPPTTTTTTPSGSSATPDTAAACRHPVPGAPDGQQTPRAGDPYVTWRNPFVYFQSIVSGPACAANDIDLSQLTTDLKSEGTTPALSYIVPSPCNDGSGLSCTPGQPADPKAAAAATDAFLQTVVPEIEHSAAYKAGGLIAITSDEAPQTGPLTDSSACCNNPVYPNLSATPGTSTSTTTSPGANGQVTPTGGGGKVGLLLISQYVKPNSTDKLDDYNHYSLLASIESLFTVSRLGYAADPNLPVFNSVTYNGYPAGG